MDKKQDAVTQPAEQTAPAESAPAEKKDTDSQPTEKSEGQPADASIEPEKKVSESVPYDRFSEVNAEKQRLAEENAYLKSQMAPAPAVGADIPDLDPDSARAVDFRVRAAITQDRTNQFISKHGEELTKDPILAGTVGQLINREAGAGKSVDHESLLQEAKKMLEERIKPVVTEAKKEAFAEGTNIAKQKEQLGEMGSSNYREPEVDDKDLSAAELAKKYNIPRV